MVISIGIPITDPVRSKWIGVSSIWIGAGCNYKIHKPIIIIIQECRRYMLSVIQHRFLQKVICHEIKMAAGSRGSRIAI